VSSDPEPRLRAGGSVAPARRNRGWIWFFALLAVLTVAGISLEIWFNLRQQLAPERLTQARRLWEAHWQGRPHDYRWEYTVQEYAGSLEVYRIQVHEDKVVSATRQQDDQDVPAETYPYGTMDALFDHIGKLLEGDQKSDGPRVFMTAAFDRRDGHVIRFIRSIRSTRERTEINVKLEAPPGPPSG
jgi:hypothetical protein